MINKEMEKIIKKVQSDSDKRMKGYLGSLQEHTDDRFKAIKEGMGAVGQKLNENTETLNSHTKMIGSIMMDMSITKEDVEIIKNNLKQKVDRNEFEALARRVSAVERKVHIN